MARANVTTAAEFSLTDLVCGLAVDLANTPHRQTYHGVDYLFCGTHCLDQFKANPDRYIEPPDRSDEQTKIVANIYTCPMHADIRQEGPGPCPKCGMALEPETIAPDSGPNPELTYMTRRFWVGLVLSIPVLVLEMSAHIPGLSIQEFLPPSLSNWIQLGLATPVVLWAGWSFFERGWMSVVTRNLNMFTLIAIGVGVAYLYSLVATAAPEMFPDAFRGSGGEVAVYFEAAAVITVLVLLGQLLELRARERTGGAIRALLDLAPNTNRP